MKITITAVSVPALRQIQAFWKRYEQQYPEDDLNIVCFYVAGQEHTEMLRLSRDEFEELWGDCPLVMEKYEILYDIVANKLGVEL